MAAKHHQLTSSRVSYRVFPRHFTRPSPTHTHPISSTMVVTEFQEKVYALLKQIPSGRVSTYKALSDALKSSPRAVGGACRNNPFAPDVPCHRVIASSGYIGGFMGDWKNVPSGENCEKKLELLEGEGVKFDSEGMLVNRDILWASFKV